MAVDLAIAACVEVPERRGGDAGDVAAHDDLDGQRRGFQGDECVGIGHGDDVVGDDVAGVGEPPRRQLVEHLALVGHGGDDAVECRQTVGGDEQTVAVGQGERRAHLAVASVGQREVDCGEGVHDSPFA
jgi:hypothetical protein